MEIRLLLFILVSFDLSLSEDQSGDDLTKYLPTKCESCTLFAKELDDAVLKLPKMVSIFYYRHNTIFVKWQCFYSAFHKIIVGKRWVRSLVNRGIWFVIHYINIFKFLRQKLYFVFTFVIKMTALQLDTLLKIDINESRNIFYH